MTIINVGEGVEARYSSKIWPGNSSHRLAVISVFGIPNPIKHKETVEKRHLAMIIISEISTFKAGQINVDFSKNVFP